MFINTQTLIQYSEQDIRTANPNTSFPYPFVAPEGYAVVFASPQPEFNRISQRVQEITPVLTSKGNWEQVWQVVELPAEVIAENQAAEIIRANDADAQRVAALWKAAHDYEYAQISGSAIGLLTMGVIQGLPKCIAVQNWIKGIWTEYYSRKASTSSDTDYSVAGTCPHSIPELMTELGM